jgi:hypothetical protein|tara:strand:- start:846 stop:1397 length:552 start_codon:yes stop_codon:yes gene_type:complete
MILEKIKLNFDYSHFLAEKQDYNFHKGSCISYQREEQNDLYNEYGNGYSYDENNTIIQQLWYDIEDPIFDGWEDQLNMDIKTVSTIMQPPGNVVTLHRDTFFKFKKLYPDDKRTKVRLNLYLEDWKIGHMIQYQDIHNKKKWTTSVDWKAGDGLLWDSSVLHLSCNAGQKDKFTMQVSGYRRD